MRCVLHLNGVAKFTSWFFFCRSTEVLLRMHKSSHYVNNCFFGTRKRKMKIPVARYGLVCRGTIRRWRNWGWWGRHTGRARQVIKWKTDCVHSTGALAFHQIPVYVNISMNKRKRWEWGCLCMPDGTETSIVSRFHNWRHGKPYRYETSHYALRENESCMRRAQFLTGYCRNSHSACRIGIKHDDEQRVFVDIVNWRMQIHDRKCRTMRRRDKRDKLYRTNRRKQRMRRLQQYDDVVLAVKHKVKHKVKHVDKHADKYADKDADM